MSRFKLFILLFWIISNHSCLKKREFYIDQPIDSGIQTNRNGSEFHLYDVIADLIDASSLQPPEVAKKKIFDIIKNNFEELQRQRDLFDKHGFKKGPQEQAITIKQAVKKMMRAN